MTLARLALHCAAAVVAATLAWPAAAQTPFPQRTVTLVVPFPPGSPVDAYARLVAQQLAGKWTKGVIVENRPGASATIGTNAVAKAAPDGHTLLFTIDLPVTMAPAILKSIPYKPEDLAPVGMVGETSNVLFVGPTVKAASVRELVEIAKAKPGSLSFASAGNGSPAHFAGELFKQAAGIDMVHVPYKGSALAMTDILNGTTSLMIGPVGQALPHVQRGAVTALAVTAPVRSPLLPNVPTLVELGYRELQFATWYAVFAPARTPPETLAAIRAAIRAAVETPEVREKARGVGIDARWGGPDQLARAAKADAATWAKVAAAAKITAD
jgi:tripartite-type tricarboxylate transporter receptor subunit TctC